MRLTIHYIRTPSVKVTPISAACPKCGIIKKSGKMSCCGRGGSWFGNCGNVGDMKFARTWHEGIWTCKTRQFQAVLDQQLHAFQSKQNAFSSNGSVRMDSKAVISYAHIVVVTRDSKLIAQSGTTASAIATNASIIVPARIPIAYHTGIGNSRVVTERTTAVTHNLVSVLTPKPTQAQNNLTMSKPTTLRIVQSMNSMAFSLHTSSAITSIHVQDRANLLRVVVRISITHAIAYWHQLTRPTW